MTEDERIYAELQAAQRRGDIPFEYIPPKPDPVPLDTFEYHERECAAMRRRWIKLRVASVEILTSDILWFNREMAKLHEAIGDTGEDSA